MAFVSSTAPAALSGSAPSRAVCERRTTFTRARATRTAAPARSPRQAPRMVFGKTVAETLASDPNFSILVQLAAASECCIPEMPACTVFAPNNAAFARLRPGLIDELMADPPAARAVLQRHILPGRTLTTKQISGCGFWEDVAGGPLGYEGLGPIIRVGNAKIVIESSNLECDNGTIHTIDTIINCPAVKPKGIAQTYTPSIPAFTDSTVASVYPSGITALDQKRAANACLPSTTGGRKAMGLVSQLPFWQYGPPFNAAKQEDYEPISIAAGDVTAGIDYQLMPPGTVIVTPDEVSAAKLLPVSGMSKYIGKTQKLVEGDAKSDYSRLDN